MINRRRRAAARLGAGRSMKQKLGEYMQDDTNNFYLFETAQVESQIRQHRCTLEACMELLICNPSPCPSCMRCVNILSLTK
jgi:hypothetical protein